MKRIGILTSGGDCQGLNAAIRGVAKALYRTVLEVLLRHEAEIMSADKDKIRAIIWDQDAGLWLVRFALAYVRLRHATPAEA